MFFEVFQPGVENLLHTVHFGAEQFALFVESPVDFVETLIDSLFEIAQALVIDEEADQNGQCRQPGAYRRDYHLHQGSQGNSLS
jgi:hypothetical protein